MYIFLISLVFAAALIIALKGLAPHIGMMDSPDERKKHMYATPTVGGVAMLIAMLIGIKFNGAINRYELTLLACATGMAILGFLDDKHNLSVRSRLLIQVVLALIVASNGNGTISQIGNVFGYTLDLGLFALPISLLAITGAINAINMIDGADGMAGSMVLITTLGAAVIFFIDPNGVSLGIPLALLGAVTGFMVFNSRIFFRKAKVFMGDAGSMWLGLVVSWMLIMVTKTSGEPLIALWLFGLPLIDTLSVMMRRIARKKSPFKADRTHIHHVFEHHGYTTGRSVLLSALGHALLVNIGLIMYFTGAPTLVVFGGFLIVFAIYYLGLKKLH